MKKLALHWQIIIGLIVGIIYSFLSSSLGWNKFTIQWISPFGEIFIRLLKLIAVPLVLFSIISGVANMPDASRLGRMGIRTLIAYLATTILAVGIGLVLVNALKPGNAITLEQRIQNRIKYELWATESNQQLADSKHLLNDPQYSNQVEAAKALLGTESTESISDRMKVAAAFKAGGPLQFLVDMIPENIFVSLADTKRMLEVIFFALFFGIVLLGLPKEKTETLKTVINSANDVFLRMVEIIMAAAPFFVFALMAGIIAKMADSTAAVIEIFKSLLNYSLVVLAGLFIMLFIVYPVLMLLLVRHFSYAEFFRRVSPAQFLAFSTSSSAATLPVTMECVRDNLGVSNNITNFVLPIGATVNMDGTSLYLGVAVIFLAQFHYIDLDFAQQMTVLLTAVLASIGTAAVPSAGLVMMIVVIQSVGLNPAWIAIIIPVDRILDMCRTVVNVTSDITVATIIGKLEGELNPPDYK